MKRAGWSLLFWLVAAAAMAQPAPAPILRATLDPPRVVVGQPVMLRIDVLAPNYLTAPPAFPDFQVRNAVTRDLGSVNMSESHDGTTYAGVRREFAIHPQEPGSYVIADQRIVVAYAADPPRSQEATLTLPRLAFEAMIPDAAQTLDPFVAATRLTLRQSVEPSVGDLKVGDAVVRTVTIEADGIPAMLLPEIRLTAPDGLAVYADQPSLQDRVDRRTDALTATRIDRATYMLQRPGTYVLPAIDIAWWNLREQKIEQAHADAVTVQVAANPALAPDSNQSTFSARAGWRAALAILENDWPIVALVLAVLATLAWLSPRAARAARGWIERRRSAYRRSELASFVQLRRTARHHDAAATYFALLAWLARFAPAAPDHTVGALRAAARDPGLDQEIALIERRLFAAGGTPAGDRWSARPLLRRVAAARRRLRRRSAAEPEATLPATLNPPGLRAAAPAQRCVAR